MPSAADLASFNRKKVADSSGQLVPKPPELPAAVKERFPELVEWERRFHEYMQKQVGMSINGGPK